jgi:hypothetical protein
MHTPWGNSDSKHILAPGILSLSTPSHGGIKVEKELNLLIPDYMRSPDGFYEEDVDWAIVATVFPHAFTPEDKAHARKTLRDWVPSAYERYYKEIIPPGQSRKKDEAAFKVAHKNDYLGLAACRSKPCASELGPGHPGITVDIPEGQVLVFAGRGGRTADYKYPKDTAYFLVPQDEYDERGPYGFVIDEEKYPRVKYKG